jgi:putative transposase
VFNFYLIRYYMKQKKITASEDALILKQISDALYNKQRLSGPEGVMTSLIKRAIEASLEGEFEAHLADSNLEDIDNRRSGNGAKRVQSKYGSFELETPRDRNSTFAPQLVKKRQININGEIDDKILSLYALGTSYEDISKHVEDIYGQSISLAAISAVTDKLMPQISEWRSRALERVYAVIFLDAMYFKVREDNRVITKCLYNIMGIDAAGHKEILGFYIAGSEGANFWLTVLNDLKNRGIEDILIACIDGLKGFPEAINTAFPKCQIQLCVVHQIRNSIRLVASKDQKKFMSDLKTVYQAPSLETAEYQLNVLSEKWNKYSAAIKPWFQNWPHLSTYFSYSAHIRKLIYTTNPIEGFHRQIRKFTKTKAAFVNENALFKLVFCAINRISQRWTAPLQNWAFTFSELDIRFPNRLADV